jgi:hypothetical protein
MACCSRMLKLHAVRHFGERVVARQVADAPLGALALGDVARDVDVALELRVLGGDGELRHGHRNGLPAGGAQHRLARLRAPNWWVEGVRCASSMKLMSGLPTRSAAPVAEQRCVASLQLLTMPSGEVTSTASLRLLSTVLR